MWWGEGINPHKKRIIGREGGEGMEGGGKFLLWLFVQLQFGGEWRWRRWHQQYEKRTAWEDKYPTASTMVAGGGNRSRILTTAAASVSNKEGRRRRRGRNTVELNRNQNRTPDQDKDRAPDQNPIDLPTIILPNPRQRHPRRSRLVPKFVGRGGGQTQYSGRIWGRHTEKRVVLHKC